MARELPAGYRFEECREWGHPGLAALMAQFAEEDPDRIGPSSAGAEPLGGQQHLLLLVRGTEAVGYAYGTRHHAGSLLDGPRLHHLFLRRDLRRKGLGLGRKLLLRWCEGVPPQYRAFGVNSPNELMRRVLGRRAAHRHFKPTPALHAHAHTTPSPDSAAPPQLTPRAVLPGWEASTSQATTSGTAAGRAWATTC